MMTPADATPADDRSLRDELMPENAAGRWNPPLWRTGTTAHAYRDCRDMRPNAEVCTVSVDPRVRRQNGVVACRYCVDRWAAEVAL